MSGIPKGVVRRAASRRAGPAALVAALSLLQGCQSMPPIATADQVDLDRFMGDWFVIAHIPITIPFFSEAGAHNAIESYERGEGNRIETTYRFREGGFDGEVREFHPTGFVREGTGNAVWGMQFVWPIKAEYRVVYLNDDYSQTVIGRSARDYVWIMARTPEMPEEDYRNILEFLEGEGYDLSEIRRVPHRYEDEPPLPLD
jgi:apolipoprotein D and lipocalin family protein